MRSRSEHLRAKLAIMAEPGRIKNPLAQKRVLHALNRFDEDPRLARIADLFNWNPSDIYRFSEKISHELLEKLSNLASALSVLPVLKVDHLGIAGDRLEDVFLYDLQAPGKAESYFLLSKFGLLKAIGKVMEVKQHVGLSGPNLSAYNKEFQSAGQDEIQYSINQRLEIVGKLGFEEIRYEMPENIDEILVNVRKDMDLSNLIDGEAAQAFGWKSFKEDPVKRELARKYFVSQIVEMLRYCSENDGKFCVHFGPEGEKAWDRVVSVILREKKWGIFGIESLNCGFFSIHYARPRVNGSLILPYSPSDLDLVPVLNDSESELEGKLSQLSILEREQLIIGLKLLEGHSSPTIQLDLQPPNLAGELMDAVGQLGVLNEI